MVRSPKRSDEVSALGRMLDFIQLFLRTIVDRPMDATEACMKIELRESTFIQTSDEDDRAKPTERL